jgi:membrane associated rhomboid family serine protease
MPFSSNIFLWVIIGLNALCSIIGFTNHEFFNKNKFSPYIVHQKKSEWFRFITAGFLHADWMHLALNMFVFYSFGSFLIFYFNIIFEKIGNTLFLLLYVAAIGVAHIPTYFKHRNNISYTSIGASGAVAAITFASILVEPTSRILMMGIPMPAIVFGIIYLGLEFYLGKRKGDFVNHDAHLWGAIFGFVATGLMKPELFLSFIEKVSLLIN